MKKVWGHGGYYTVECTVGPLVMTWVNVPARTPGEARELDTWINGLMAQMMRWLGR